MSDTEEAPTPVKAKRTMTPEARERMLANLAKGREAKLKKAAERRQSKSDQEKRETNEKDLGVSYGEPINQKLTCPQLFAACFGYRLSLFGHYLRCPPFVADVSCPSCVSALRTSRLPATFVTHIPATLHLLRKQDLRAQAPFLSI